MHKRVRGDQPQTNRTADLISRTLWYVQMRWFILILVIVPSLIASYIDVGWSGRFMRDLAFCGLMLASNGIFNLLARTLRGYRAIRTLAYALTMIDIVFVGFFIYTKGGIESRSVILYILPIIASAAILGRKGAYVTSSLAILTYTFVVGGGYLGYLGPLSMYTPTLDHDPGYVANTVIFFDLVMLMAAFGIDYMTRLLIQKEAIATTALGDLRRTQLIARVGAWEYDRATDSLIYSDELFAIMRTILPGRILRTDAFEALIHPDDRAMVMRRIRSALKRPQRFSFEHRMLSPDGIVQYLRLDGQSVVGADGTVERLVGSARDVSEERALQKARGDFVALASHQLRTPATIVKQYVALVKDGYAGMITPDQTKYLQAAYDNNERQIKIVNDLLNVARIDSNAYRITRSETDLVELLQTIVRDQSAKFAEKQHRLTFDTRLRALAAQVDADGLRMAIDNLLDNAHKYKPEGKRVDVKLVRRDAGAVITVADRGVGIDKTDVPKMFKMFSRIDNPQTLQQEGTGLGLYWSARIIKLHKGKIAVASEPGKGTTFSITLPLGT